MLQKIIDYIRGLRMQYDSSYLTGHRFTVEEKKIGRIALVSVQELIKIQHIKNGGNKHNSIMRMDGNADNYHELDNYKISTKCDLDDELNEFLVKIARKLLRYGS